MAKAISNYYTSNKGDSVKDIALSSYSSKDKPWDKHRSNAQDIQSIYYTASEFEKYAERIGKCSGVLLFGQNIDQDTGEISLKLKHAYFCRVRHCPVCQWRRSLMWQARFYQALPKIEQEHPKACWIFLTLTVRNCPVDELKTTLQAMNQAWQRFIKRKEFKPVQGFVRTTEITRGKKGDAHPHFHVLLMVPPSMLAGNNYISQSKWTDLWQDCLRVTYTPVVHVQAVKNKNTNDPRTGLERAVAETLKYAVKPDDVKTDPDWFLEMTKQIHKMRFVATGGVLKDVLKVEEETQEELALIFDDDGKENNEDKKIAFNWRSSDRKYRRYEKGDK